MNIKAFNGTNGEETWLNLDNQRLVFSIARNLCGPVYCHVSVWEGMEMKREFEWNSARNEIIERTRNGFEREHAR